MFTRAKGATRILLALTIRNICTAGPDGKQHIERDMGFDAEIVQLSAECVVQALCQAASLLVAYMIQ